MKKTKFPATESQVIEYFENMDCGQIKQFMDRIIRGKKPTEEKPERPIEAKKIGCFDRLCWRCEHARLQTCPQTESHEKPDGGMWMCPDWVTSPTVEYGDSPAKKRAIRDLLWEPSKQPK